MPSSIQGHIERDPAEEIITRAIAAARDRHFDQAASFFREALAIAPGQSQTHRLLAQALSDSGNLIDSESAWMTYLSMCPDDADGHRHLGNLRKRMEKFDAAIESLCRAIELDGTSPALHVDWGVALAHAKRHDEAKTAFLRALELTPDYYDALINLGILMQELRDGKLALTYLRKAIEVKPSDPSGRNNLGVALAEQGQFDEAVACYHDLLAISPDYVLAWNNLGNALRSIGRNTEAMKALKRALELKPDYTEAHNNLGIIFAQLEDFDEAIRSYNRALLLRPDYPEAHANRGLVYLLRGDFQQGWADYEWRWQGTRGLKRRNYMGKPWDGSPVSGKRVLLYYEQGLGDTFQFVRYARELKARGAIVILECQPHMRQILGHTPGIDEFIIRGEKPPICDFYAPLLSLPGLFQTNLDSLPRRVPYVFADPAMNWDWKQRIAAIPGFKVGIVWQGNPEHKGDRNRSIPLKHFAPLAAVPGVTLISLQKNFGSEQLSTIASDFAVKDLKGVAESGDGWLRTAAIIANLDLVIGADTSVVHLAGAMGVPVWIVLPTSPDWRWLLNRDDTPWYPTMRLFRQNFAGDWPELFARAAEALNTTVLQAESPIEQAVEEPGMHNAEDLLCLAAKHLQSDELHQAQSLLEWAVRLDPTNSAAHQDLGVAFARQKRLVEAIACFRRGLELAPDSAGLHSNLGLALYNCGSIEGSVSHLQKAVWLGAGSADTYKNLARALSGLPDPGAAEEAYWSALRLRPDDAEAHYLLSSALLAQGKFEQGWLEREWRIRWKKSPDRAPSSIRWTGQKLEGKRMLIVANGDQRDVVQLARYAHLMATQGCHIALECDPFLAKLLAGCVGIERIVPAGQPRPHHDFHINLLSLPAALETTINTIPTDRPYLGVESTIAVAWNRRVSSLTGVKVGLALDEDVAISRNSIGTIFSMNLKRAKLDRQVTWLDLSSQTRSGIGELHAAAETAKAIPCLADLADLPSDDAEFCVALAGAMRQMDLIIASDNLTAHIAGAMGIPTWVVLPMAAHCRWMVNRDDTPWYPTMRLFRQRRRHVWDDVIDRITNALLTRLLTVQE